MIDNLSPVFSRVYLIAPYLRSPFFTVFFSLLSDGGDPPGIAALNLFPHVTVIRFETLGTAPSCRSEGPLSGVQVLFLLFQWRKQSSPPSSKCFFSLRAPSVVHSLENVGLSSEGGIRPKPSGECLIIPFFSLRRRRVRSSCILDYGSDASSFSENVLFFLPDLVFSATTGPRGARGLSPPPTPPGYLPLFPPSFFESYKDFFYFFPPGFFPVEVSLSPPNSLRGPYISFFPSRN